MVVVVEKKVVRLKVETQVTFGKLSASKTAVRDVRAADAGDRHQLKITNIIFFRASVQLLSCLVINSLLKLDLHDSDC